MPIVIDKELCIGCGTCAALCPKIFQLGNDNKAQVTAGAVMDEEIRVCAQSAVDSCPVQAIKISET